VFSAFATVTCTELATGALGFNTQYSILTIPIELSQGVGRMGMTIFDSLAGCRRPEIIELYLSFGLIRIGRSLRFDVARYLCVGCKPQGFPEARHGFLGRVLLVADLISNLLEGTQVVQRLQRPSMSTPLTYQYSLLQY
jgi:hypothetical protein